MVEEMSESYLLDNLLVGGMQVACNVRDVPAHCPIWLVKLYSGDSVLVVLNCNSGLHTRADFASLVHISLWWCLIVRLILHLNTVLAQLCLDGADSSLGLPYVDDDVWGC